MGDHPTRLRIPLDRNRSPGADRLNEGTNHLDVAIEIDPTLDRRGEVRGLGQPFGEPRVVIVLREWNEQVLLHELLHVLPLPGATDADPHNHDVVSRVEVALWETGWRLVAADA